jgi:O-antigen/teichoic acid export membrane protein
MWEMSLKNPHSQKSYNTKNNPMKKQNVTHGTIYLMFAQAAFVASGYAIHIGLARLLGPSDYGIYAVVISLMTMVNLILTTGIPQATNDIRRLA